MKHKNGDYHSKKKKTINPAQIDGTVCKTKIIVRRANDKEFLKEMSPIFIWGVVCMVSLGVMCRTSHMIAGLVFVITAVLIIPITVRVYKRTAKFRKEPQTELEAVFIVSEGDISMNGKRVTITRNSMTDKFNIMLDRWSGYEVQNSEEFATFLRTNYIFW